MLVANKIFAAYKIGDIDSNSDDKLIEKFMKTKTRKLSKNQKLSKSRKSKSEKLAKSKKLSKNRNLFKFIIRKTRPNFLVFDVKTIFNCL